MPTATALANSSRPRSNRSLSKRTMGTTFVFRFKMNEPRVQYSTTRGRPSTCGVIRSESSLSGHEAGLGLFSRCPGDDPVHQTRDTSRAVPAHICNGNAGLEHTKPLVRYPLCQARCLSLDVL